jgi:phage shock protein PspC (stress-responsive transcriptional regulator)
MDSKQSDFWESVRNLKKSATDKKIAGVCAGFGEHTPMPAWLWRALFLVLGLCLGGSGSSLILCFGSACLQPIIGSNRKPITVTCRILEP